MLETLFRFGQKKPVEAVVAVESQVARPALPNMRLERIQAQAETEAVLAEYKKLSEEIGVVPPDLGIETFKALLVKLDYPIFSLVEVIRYMDNKAAKESVQGAGWCWRPLRAKDNLRASWGHEGEAEQRNRERVIVRPASDHYAGLREITHSWLGDGKTYLAGGSEPYHRTVPIHALRRVSAIEREYQGPVSFFVSEYAPMPEIRHPDPFLMAVIPNPHLAKGDGRFVIDFWEEPGFGIEQMLK